MSKKREGGQCVVTCDGCAREVQVDKPLAREARAALAQEHGWFYGVVRRDGRPVAVDLCAKCEAARAKRTTTVS